MSSGMWATICTHQYNLLKKEGMRVFRYGDAIIRVAHMTGTDCLNPSNSLSLPSALLIISSD